MTRIRTQLKKIAELQASGECEVSAATVTLPDDSANRSLPQQVQGVAERVTEMARHDLSKKIVSVSVKKTEKTSESENEHR